MFFGKIASMSQVFCVTGYVIFMDYTLIDHNFRQNAREFYKSLYKKTSSGATLKLYRQIFSEFVE